MDKQDELAAVILAAWAENGEVPFPLYEREPERIAAAVRSFMGSDEVRHRVARALHGLDNNDDLWLPGWFDVEARAALSAAIGEDIGGGRG